MCIYIFYCTITCLTIALSPFLRLHPCMSSSDLRKHLLGADILVNSMISIKTELVSTMTMTAAPTAETTPSSSSPLDIRVYRSTHRCLFRTNRIYLTFFITRCINTLLIIFLIFYLYILFYTYIQMIIIYFHERLKLK